MKSIIEFLNESLFITEGGHAVECRPMTQREAKAVYDDVCKEILPDLGLDGEDGDDHCTLGSFGKKIENATSGDIDIAVSALKIAATQNIALDDVEEKIVAVIEQHNLQYTYSRGIHVISVQYPIPGAEQSAYGQVDFMPSTSIDYTRWMYYSPDFRVNESKYKGLYRNQLIMAILHFVDHETMKTNDEGQIVEFERYALRLGQGLARVRRSFEGKRGLLKNDKALKEYERIVTNVPDEIVRVAFNENVDAKNVMTFEQAWALFMGDRTFKHPELRERIVKKFIGELKGVAPVPNEVSDAFPQLIDVD